MVKEMMKPLGAQSFLLGLGVAAAAYFIGPQLREAMRPMAVKGMQGAMALGGMTREALHQGKEKMEHMMPGKMTGESVRDAAAEVYTMQEALIRELREERQASNKMMEELKNSIVNLKEEIEHVKSAVGPMKSGVELENLTDKKM